MHHLWLPRKHHQDIIHLDLGEAAPPVLEGGLSRLAGCQTILNAIRTKQLYHIQLKRKYIPNTYANAIVTNEKYGKAVKQ
jgi:hypothetical protein